MESNGLIQHGSAGVAERPPELTMLQVIAAAAQDERVDVAKMAALLEMKERLDSRNAEMAYNQAMARLQPKLPRITKEGKIDLGRGTPMGFARLEDIDRAIRPLLTEEGFSVSFTSEDAAAGVLMTCVVSHIEGHSKQSKMHLPADSGPGRNSLQAIGSARSYAKRYLICDMLNIVTVGSDDDARSIGRISEQQAETLWTLIADCGMDKNKKLMDQFLSYMMAKKYTEIYADDFKKAVTVLEGKRKQIEKEKANGNLSSN